MMMMVMNTVMMMFGEDVIASWQPGEMYERTS